MVKKFTFSVWYEQNKERLSEKRKTLYRADPEYRKKVQERSAMRRLANPPSPKTGISVSDVCGLIDVSPWTLNRWKNEQLFPVKTLRGHRFTENQVQLLGLLRQFFDQYPKLSAKKNSSKLEEIVNVVNHNWD